MRISYIDEFLELYKCMNYNEAARNLFISQSTLSKHIVSLEDSLGVKLFNRDKYYMEPTTQGSEFYTYANTISKTYKAAQEQFANESVVKGRFLIGGLVDGRREISWLNKAVVEVQKKYPQFKPMFIPSGINSPLAELAKGNLDALIFSAYEQDKPDTAPSGIETIHVGESPLYAIVSKACPLAKKEILVAEDLKRYVFIQMMGPRMQSGWRAVQRFIESQHIEYSVRQVPIMSMYDYAGVTLGDNEIMLLPRAELAPNVEFRDRDENETVTVPIDAPEAFIPIDLIYRKDTTPTCIKEFAEELKKREL